MKRQEGSGSYRNHGTGLVGSPHVTTLVCQLSRFTSLEETVKVHQTRVKPCPDGLLTGYYWYGNKRKRPGHPPKCVEKVLSNTDKEAEIKPQEEPESSMASVTETESSVELTEPELNEHESPEHKSVQVANPVLRRYPLRRNPKPPKRLH